MSSNPAGAFIILTIPKKLNYISWSNTVKFKTVMVFLLQCTVYLYPHLYQQVSNTTLKLLHAMLFENFSDSRSGYYRYAMCFYLPEWTQNDQKWTRR